MTNVGCEDMRVQSVVFCKDIRRKTNTSAFYDDEIKSRADRVGEQRQQLQDVKTQVRRLVYSVCIVHKSSYILSYALIICSSVLPRSPFFKTS